MPSADQEAFDLLATRFLSGEASGQEYARLFEFLKTKKWNTRFSRMQLNWDAAKAGPTPGFDLKAAAKRLAAEIAKDSSAPKPSPATKARIAALSHPAKRSSKRKKTSVLSRTTITRS